MLTSNNDFIQYFSFPQYNQIHNRGATSTIFFTSYLISYTKLSPWWQMSLTRKIKVTSCILCQFWILSIICCRSTNTIHGWMNSRDWILLYELHILITFHDDLLSSAHIWASVCGAGQKETVCWKQYTHHTSHKSSHNRYHQMYTVSLTWMISALDMQYAILYYIGLSHFENQPLIK